MNTSSPGVNRQFLFLLFASTILGGCAVSPLSATEKVAAFDAQKRAIERSTARWKALTDKRFDESFQYLSDASKIGTNASDYAGSMQRMGFLSAVVENATCAEGICTVTSNVTLPIFVKNVGARPQTLPVYESWVVNNGELWLIRR